MTNKLNCTCRECEFYDFLARDGKVARRDLEELKANAHLFKARLEKSMKQVLYKRAVITTEDDGRYDEERDNRINRP